jgi:ribose/xylose/arabinose/galactoside ABC-type transport system permease subunit
MVLGWLVAYVRIPAIVVTLGMLSILKGGLILWTDGQRVTGMPPEFFLAQMRPLGVPMPVWFMLILTLLAALWMRYSPRGRALYAVGGNAEAARLSGLLQQRIVFNVFVINGVFAGIASVLYASQLRVIQATPPPALELAIITAAVVGGVSILGGKGTVIGAMLAAILLNAIRSGMIFVNVSPFWIQAIQGLLILATVLIDLARRQPRRRKKRPALRGSHAAS